MTGFPLLLDLAGKPVVVVGGGRVGRRRATSLAEAGADVLVVDPTPIESASTGRSSGSGLPAPSVRTARREWRPADLDGAWLAVAATDDPAVNERVAAAAAERRIFCVRADAAAGGTARVPAVARAGAVTVAVNAGDDPARAAELRDAVALAIDTGALGARPRRIAAAGSVVLVGGGPGDPELITVRGRRLVAE